MKRRISILDALEYGKRNRFLQAALDRGGENKGDILHTNALEILDGVNGSPICAFQNDHYLISSRTTSAIMVIDPVAVSATWIFQGAFRLQHSPKLLANGRLLLFDNEGEKPRSVIRELDPKSGKEVWAYRGTDADPFYSRVNGRCHRLPNGNTFIIASVGSRAFEVDAAGAIVWEYWNPYRGGPENKYIARIFEMTRLPRSFPVSWTQVPNE